MTSRDGRVLVATVGTGNSRNPEDSLITPMLKSINDGSWRSVVLLPSRATASAAEEVRRRVADLTSIEVKPLEKDGEENDADACFRHFDRVLRGVLVNGVRSDYVVADFTRGTKAMSAALVLAAVGADVPLLRYVHGSERDERGAVLPGSEEVGEFKTAHVMARRRMALAVDLLKHGNFPAAAELLPSGPFLGLLPEAFRQESETLRSISEIAAAWDRLDYTAASTLAQGQFHKSDADRRNAPLGREVMQWLARLSRQPDTNDGNAMAHWLRDVACDLLANAERRLKARHYEDALLRAYRVLELVGQIRLFERGYNTSRMPPQDPRVKRFREHLKARHGREIGAGQRGRYLMFSRETSAMFLEYIGDALATRLLEFDDDASILRAGSRNHSILIHGFEKSAPSDPEGLSTLLMRMETLLLDDDPEASARLKLARGLSFDGL